MAGKKRFISQAALQALIRYNPELSGLKELQRTAQGNYRSSVKQARAQALGTQGAVAAAVPALASIYDSAGLTQAALSKDLIGEGLAGLRGDVGKLYQRAGQLDAAGAASRLNAAKAFSLTDLIGRGVRAEEGKGFAINSARDQLVTELSKILTRKQEVRRERGAYQAEVIGELQGEQAQRSFEAHQKALDRATRTNIAAADRTSRETIAAGHDATSRANARDRARGTRLSGGAKLQSQSAHNSLLDKIGAARDEASAFVRQALKEGHSRSFIDSALRDGIPGYTVRDPTTGRIKIDQSGAPVTQPGIKAVPALQRQIILDVLIDGHVSSKTIKALHRRGYSVRQLGLPRPKQGKGARGAAPAATGGKLGGRRPT